MIQSYRTDRADAGLDNVKTAVAAIACEANLMKSGVWANGPCDLGNAGFARLHDLPLVMKQPLSAFQKSLDPAHDAHLSADVQKMIKHRSDLSKRLENLRGAGLSA